MKLLKALVLILICSRAGAQGLSLQSSTEERRSLLVISGEYNSFTLPTGSLTGFGAKLNFNHFFTDSVAVDTYFSTAFGSDGGVQSSFTGMGAYLTYAVLGSCCSANKTVTVSGFPTITEKTELSNLLQVGIGVDQFFMNGSQNVYPSSGVGLSLSYDFGMLDRHFRVSTRASMMTASRMKNQGLFLGLGILFPL